MLYADVIVRQRTNVEQLTYSVPASVVPYIQLGAVVKVPLRRREVAAVVVKLRSKIESELRTKVREISSIDKKAKGFNPAQIKVIESLADYLGASLAEVAYHALAFPSPLLPVEPSELKKPIFLQASWLDRLKFYRDVVKKYRGKRRLVFLFAIEKYAEEFARELSGEDVFTDVLSAAQSRALQRAIADKKPIILIGSQKWAFFPLAPNDVLLLDQPDHVGMRLQRRPYPTIKRVGLIRSADEGIQLIMAADLLAVGDYHHKTDRSWRVIDKKLSPTTLTILSRQRSPEILLSSFQEELMTAVAKQQRVFVFVASKGYAAALFCREHGAVLSCPRCSRPIGLKNPTTLACRYCGWTGARPRYCPGHSHEELILLGEGTGQVQTALRSLFPDQKITEITSDTSDVPAGSINVGTERILSFPTATFDHIFIAAADRMLSAVNPNSGWHLLTILLGLRSRTKKLTVQTHFPDHWVWTALSTGRLGEFFEAELKERQQFRLPPFGEELRLVGSDGSAKNIETQAETVAEQVATTFPMVVVSAPLLSVRDGRQQASLTLYQSKNFTSTQKRQLRALLMPSWFLIVD